MVPKMLEEVSKTISYYLRHRPEELQISLDSEGWTDLDTLLKLISEKLKILILKNDVEQILNTSKKKRFEIKEKKIRALYGHSTKNLKIEYPRLLQAIPLYHGTPTKNLSKIHLQGLQKGERNFVHLTNDKNLAYSCANRYANEVIILEIDTEKYLNEGGIIYVASDGVYLCEEIPSKYIIFQKKQ